MHLRVHVHGLFFFSVFRFDPWADEQCVAIWLVVSGDVKENSSYYSIGCRVEALLCRVVARERRTEYKHGKCHIMEDDIGAAIGIHSSIPTPQAFNHRRKVNRRTGLGV